MKRKIGKNGNKPKQVYSLLTVGSQTYKVQINLLKATKALVMRDAYLGLFSEVIEAILEEDYQVNQYVCGILADNLKFVDEEDIFLMLKGLRIDGELVNVDDYFSGNYELMVNILLFAVNENFGSVKVGVRV